MASRALCCQRNALLPHYPAGIDIAHARLHSVGFKLIPVIPTGVLGPSIALKHQSWWATQPKDFFKALAMVFKRLQSSLRIS